MNNNVVSLIVFSIEATKAVHDCGLGKLLACHFVSAEKEEPMNLMTEGAFSIEGSLFRVIGWVENITNTYVD